MSAASRRSPGRRRSRGAWSAICSIRSVGFPVADVVRRLCGVQAQVASSAELAVRVRRQSSRPGEVARALADGRLIKTWAMRGALHLLTPEEGGAFLSLIAAATLVGAAELAALLRHDPEADRDCSAARSARRSTARPLTREELVAAVVAQRGLGHLGEALRSGWGTLLKPLAWQGDLCYGPSRGTRVTFMLPEAASSRWAGVPDPDEAAPIAIRAYLGAYGPATIDAFGNWLAGGWFGEAAAAGWFDSLGDQLAEVEVEGERAFVLAEDLDELASAKPTTAVRLLPWVRPVRARSRHGRRPCRAAARRRAVSKQSGWISPVVVAGGVVCGTWELDGDGVQSPGSGRPASRRGGAGRGGRAALLDPRSRPPRHHRARLSQGSSSSTDLSAPTRSRENTVALIAAAPRRVRSGGALHATWLSATPSPWRWSLAMTLLEPSSQSNRTDRSGCVVPRRMAAPVNQRLRRSPSSTA